MSRTGRQNSEIWFLSLLAKGATLLFLLSLNWDFLTANSSGWNGYGFATVSFWLGSVFGLRFTLCFIQLWNFEGDDNLFTVTFRSNLFCCPMSLFAFIANFASSKSSSSTGDLFRVSFEGSFLRESKSIGTSNLVGYLILIKLIIKSLCLGVRHHKS